MFSLCVAEYGAEHAVVEPRRASWGSWDHRESTFPGAGAALPTGYEAALPYLQRFVHGPTLPPDISYLKMPWRNMLPPHKACFPVIPPPVCRLRETPQRPAITHCLRNNHFKCQALKMCRNLSRLLKSSETQSCKVPLLGKYTCRYRFTHHYAAQVPNFNYTYKWKDILKATAVL